MSPVLCRISGCLIGSLLLVCGAAWAQLKSPNKYISEAQKSKLKEAGGRFDYDLIESAILDIYVYKRDSKPGADEITYAPLVHSTGFLISSDGYFVATLSGLKECLGPLANQPQYSVSINCSKQGEEYYLLANRTVTQKEGSEVKVSHPVSIVSHPAAILGQKDLLIGKIELKPEEKVPALSFYSAREPKIFAPRKDQSTSDVWMDESLNPVNTDDIESLRAAKNKIKARKFFFAGYPSDRGFQIGFSYIVSMSPQRVSYTMFDESRLDQRMLKLLKIPAQEQLGSLIEAGSGGSPLLDADGLVYGMASAIGDLSALFLSSDLILTQFFTPDPKLSKHLVSVELKNIKQKWELLGQAPIPPKPEPVKAKPKPKSKPDAKATPTKAAPQNAVPLKGPSPKTGKSNCTVFGQ